MTARPLTIQTMGTPFVRKHMPGHRQFSMPLSRRLAAPADGTNATVEARSGKAST